MAETQKVVIATLDINVDAVITKQKELTVEINKTKQAQKDYEAAVKKGEEVSAEQTTAYIENQATLKNLNTEYSQNTRLLQAQQKVQEDGIKTIDDARAALSAVSVQWARSKQLTGEDSEATKKLNTDKTNLTAKLKELESATGDNTRNVGNYSSALDGISAKLGPLGGLLKGFATGTQTVGGALSSLGGVMKGLIANPFFGIIALLAGVFIAIKEAIGKNAEIMDKLAVALKPVQLLFGAIMNVVGKLVEMLVGGFADAMTWVADLFDGASDSTKKYIDAVKNLQEIEDKMINQRLKDKQLQEEINELDAIAIDRTKTKEERLKALTDSIAKQKQIAKENADLQTEQLKNYALDLQGTYGIKGALVTKDMQLSEEALNKLSEDDKKALETQISNYLDAKNKKSEIDKETMKKKSTLESGITAEEEAENTKRIENRKKSNERYIKILEYEVNFFKATNESKIKDDQRLTESLVLGEIARLEKLRQLETAANEKAFKLGLKLKEDYTLEKIAIEQRFIDAENELAQKQLDQSKKDLDIAVREFNLANQSKLKGAKELTADLVAEETLRLDKQREFLEAQAILEITNEEELALKRREIKAASDAEIAALNTQFQEQEKAKRDAIAIADNQAEFDLKQQQSNNEFDRQKNDLERNYQAQITAAEKLGASTTAITQKYELQQTAIKRAQLMAQLGIAATILGNMADLFGKATTAGKVAASAQTAASTIQGAMGAFAQASGAFPPPFGQIVGGIAAGVIGAQGAKSIRDIWAVKETGETSAPSTPSGSGSIPTIPTGASNPMPTNFDGGFSAQSIGGSSGTTQVIQQPVLVVDNVTALQMQQGKINQVATI